MARARDSERGKERDGTDPEEIREMVEEIGLAELLENADDLRD